MNSSGRILTVFLVIIVILLISLTAISIFFFQKESERRQVAELNLDKSEATAARLDNDLKDLKQKNFLLQEKNSEADERINSLMDDLELEAALREEIKNENVTLKANLESLEKEKSAAEVKLNEQISSFKQKIDGLEKSLEDEKSRRLKIQERLKGMEAVNKELESKISGSGSGQGRPSGSELQKDVKINNPAKNKGSSGGKSDVELAKIVVVPEEIPEGRILSVDSETEFVIINLGEKDGLKLGNVMAVYRGNEYLGDIKVTRIQPEMSAADLMPPFSSSMVRKNDQVIARP